MTIPAPDAPAYTDLKGLSALKHGAANKDPAAIREVARQFESMFTRMMLKSMRDATGKDPVFGSDQEQMYQGMADDQLSLQLSRGKGLGLADMLVRQLQKMGVAGADAAAGTGDNGGKTALPAASSVTGAAAAYRAIQSTSAAQGTPASSAVQKDFIRTHWSDAQQAARQLGVDPGSLLSQAALETNWGRALPQDATGRSSNNLFGIKASDDWAGSSVSSTTQEFQNGVAGNTTSQFRSYANPTQSFQDYVALLRNNPRYSSALNTGGNVQAFAAGLQRGGYATDPDYVHKISAVAHSVAGTLAQSPDVTDLKSASAQPITANTGAL